MNYFLISQTGDAYYNLALDEYLLNTLSEDDKILYLYVNEKAVIIGRNQNPWIECNLNQLNADGVQLVRRISGGGAVYHDSGNLNFSFICGEKNYDEAHQTWMILKALNEFGIEAETTGRNDIAVNGRKISGNAYCRRGKMYQRHGTLLISSDMSVFDRYLVVPKTKLVAKGVKSVRSRIMNLSEMNSEISVESLSKMLEKVYGENVGEVEKYILSEDAESEVRKIREKAESWQWRMGEAPAFDCVIENRFSFGTAQICLKVKNGLICECEIFTDSLDTALPERIRPLFLKLRFDKDEIHKKLSESEGEAKEIAEYILSSFE